MKLGKNHVTGDRSYGARSSVNTEIERESRKVLRALEKLAGKKVDKQKPRYIDER